MTTAQDGGKVVNLQHPTSVTPRKYSWYSFLLEAERKLKWNYKIQREKKNEQYAVEGVPKRKLVPDNLREVSPSNTESPTLVPIQVL